MDLLLSQINSEDKSAWPIYGQWAQRGFEKDDGSPNAPRQGDGYNCAILALANALNMKFGFDLLCYRQRDLDSLQRPRIFSELKTGASGVFKDNFAYDMLDIPNGPLYKCPMREKDRNDAAKDERIEDIELRERKANDRLADEKPVSSQQEIATETALPNIESQLAGDDADDEYDDMYGDIFDDPYVDCSGFQFVILQLGFVRVKNVNRIYY